MVRIYAHRGAAAERPENTLPAFRRAVELGAGALELDVHLTRDGEVVVAHDPDGARMAGVGRTIAASTLAEVRAWDVGWGFRAAAAGGGRPFAAQGITVPTLDEVLGEFADLPVNVDLKAPSVALVEAFVALARRRGAEERLIAASFHERNLTALRRRGWTGGVALGWRGVARVLAAPRLRPLGTAAQLPTRAGPLRLAHPLVVSRCHAAGLRVDFWTVNDPAEALALAAMGADGIMTDDPARICPLFQGGGSR